MAGGRCWTRVWVSVRSAKSARQSGPLFRQSSRFRFDNVKTDAGSVISTRQQLRDVFCHIFGDDAKTQKRVLNVLRELLRGDGEFDARIIAEFVNRAVAGKQNAQKFGEMARLQSRFEPGRISRRLFCPTNRFRVATPSSDWVSRRAGGARAGHQNHAAVARNRAEGPRRDV